MFFLILFFILLYLCGCSEHYETQSSKEGAISYFQNKYGYKLDVVEDYLLYQPSPLWGSNKFGWVYLLSDGTSVIYLDSDKKYRDDKQGEEIENAAMEYAYKLMNEIFKSQAEKITINFIGDKYDAYSYKGKEFAFIDYYDGDIGKWLKKNKLYLNYESLSYNKICVDLKKEEALDALYNLSFYFDISNLELISAKRSYYESVSSSDFSRYDQNVRFQVYARKDKNNNLKYYVRDNSCFPLNNELSVINDTYNYTIEKNDITIESIGNDYYILHLADNLKRKKNLNIILKNNNLKKNIYMYKDVDQFHSLVESFDFSYTYTFKIKDGMILYYNFESDEIPSISVSNIYKNGFVVKYNTKHFNKIKKLDLKVSINIYDADEYIKKIKKIDDTTWHVILNGNIPDDELNFWFNFSYISKDSGKKLDNSFYETINFKYLKTM